MRILLSTSLLIGMTFAAGTAFAGPADDAIAGRQACMKAHGAMMGLAVPVMKGEKQFDAEAMNAAYAKEDAACADWAKFWIPESMQGETLKTTAKKEIWDDPKGFEAAGAVWYEAAQKLRAATDEASFKAAFPAVGAGCQGCHEKFRTPTN